METLLNARLGINPNATIRAEREAARSRQAVGDLWASYSGEFLAVRAREATRRSHESLWRTWLAAWKSKPIDQVDGPALRALHASIAVGRRRASVKGCGKGRRSIGGERTANKSIQLLRRLYSWSRIEPNPVKAGVVEYFRMNSRERFLSQLELKRFMAALADEHDLPARDFIELAIYTGARKSNVLSMCWGEIDFEAATWTIPKSKTKGGRVIVVPLVPAALGILSRRRASMPTAASDHRVLSRGRDAYNLDPRNAFARVCAAAKIDDLHIHDLRRTLGSWMASAGVSLPIIGKALGHKSQASTAIYARVTMDPVRLGMTEAVASMHQAAGLSPPPPAHGSSGK